MEKVILYITLRSVPAGNFATGSQWDLHISFFLLSRPAVDRTPDAFSRRNETHVTQPRESNQPCCGVYLSYLLTQPRQIRLGRCIFPQTTNVRVRSLNSLQLIMTNCPRMRLADNEKFHESALPLSKFFPN